MGFHLPPIEFDLGILRGDAVATEPIDWSALEAELRPEEIPDDLWAVIWPRIQSQIGDTLADYLKVLVDNARYLAEHRRRTYDDYMAHM